MQGKGKGHRWEQSTPYKVREAFVHTDSADLTPLCVGVMRFLQTEWHRHERDRNAWEIERAEMKSRIGRLEGDIRTTKRSNDSLGKYVKILEIALRKEREKTKSLANGEKVDVHADPKELAKEALKSLPHCKRPGLDSSVSC